MAERIQKNKETSKKEAAPQAEVDAQVDEEAEKLKAETDALMDEIDSVLEENAEEFVKGYVQKGGQAVAVAWKNIKDGFLAPLRGLSPLGWQ